MLTPSVARTTLYSSITRCEIYLESCETLLRLSGPKSKLRRREYCFRFCAKNLLSSASESLKTSISLPLIIEKFNLSRFDFTNPCIPNYAVCRSQQECPQQGFARETPHSLSLACLVSMQGEATDHQAALLGLLPADLSAARARK